MFRVAACASLRLGVAFIAALLTLDTPLPGKAQADDAFVRVRRGDTLFGLARELSTTVTRLRARNDIDGSLIVPGQRLWVDASGLTSPRGEFRPVSPLAGASKSDVRRSYGERRNPRHKRVSERHTGVDLAAATGATVRCAESGVVRFLGDVLGFGLLVIVEHRGDHRTVYSPLEPGSVRVAEGEVVRVRQPLGRLGAPVETESSALHFEIRRGEQAKDPLTLLRW